MPAQAASADGRPVDARRRRIGEVLVEMRKIAPEVLRAAVHVLGPDPADHVVGEHLQREGLVEGTALREALERQVGCTIRELLQWKGGEFAFDRDAQALAARPERPIAVDVQGVLMDAFREQDEAARDLRAHA